MFLSKSQQPLAKEMIDRPWRLQKNEPLRSLSDVKIEKRVVSEFAVTVLGPDAALVTHVADMEGTYRGEPLPSRAFVSGIMVRRDGRWLEKMYQVTTLKP